MLFDILELNGQSLIKKSYQERREILENLVSPRPGSSDPGTTDLRRRSTGRA